MPKELITIELDVELLQEINFTIKKKARDIDYVLDNRPPSKHEDVVKLDNRARLLTKTATLIDKALNDRAKVDPKIVKISANRK